MKRSTPTCTMRGVIEEHTTPEALSLVANVLTRQQNIDLVNKPGDDYNEYGFNMVTGVVAQAHQ